MTISDGEELISVGRIFGAHGIRGEVKVESLTDFPERFREGEVLILVTPEGAAREVTIRSSRIHRGAVLILIDESPDRNAAEALRGGFFKIREKDLMRLPAGEFYHFQLVGLEVRTEDGDAIGTIEEVMPTGARPVLVVRKDGREVLLPHIDDVVRAVDLKGGTMTVRLLEGLIPEA